MNDQNKKGKDMDIKKLKEEIKLLERKVELLEQWTELQRLADEYNKKVPVYPTYPQPFYPQPVYPWDRVIYGGGTTTIPSESISAYNGPATSGTVIMKEGDKISYTDCTPPILKNSGEITIRGMSWGKSPQHSVHKIMV